MASIKETMSTMSRSKMLLVGFVLAAAYYYFAFDNGAPLGKELEANSNELQAITKQVADTQKAVSDSKRFEQEVNSISEQFHAALNFLPTNMDVQDILSNLSRQARAAGVSVVAVQPKNPEMKDFYEEILMEVEIVGTYTQLVTFLSYVSKLQRIINVRNIQMDIQKQVDYMPVLVMKGTLVGYRYVETK